MSLQKRFQQIRLSSVVEKRVFTLQKQPIRTSWIQNKTNLKVLDDISEIINFIWNFEKNRFLKTKINRM